jgi:Fe-S-cluster containining protein
LRCALCCGDTEGKRRSILLLKIEADRISKKTSKRIRGFADKKVDSEPYIYRMKMTDEGKCVFLRCASCSIYEIRPVICRFFPFQLKNLGKNRYLFAYTEECPGIGEGSTLEREFFERLFGRFIELMKEDDT